MISKEEHSKLREKYNPDGSVLRKAQLRMLEMLDFLDKVCQENNLTYWLDGGTLLGAKRHGGFIPWDDDTDVAMPYADMLKLKNIVNSSHNQEFVIQNHENDPNYFANWVVLRDLKSEYLQDSYLHNMRKYRGLQVDIFPIESNSNFLRHISCKLSSHYVTKPIIKGNVTRRRLKLVNFSHFIITKILFSVFRLFKSSKQKCNYGLGIGYQKFYKKEDIYPLGIISFEGHEFCAPNNTESYLKSWYGNWQDIPDEDNIVTHEVNVVFK